MAYYPGLTLQVAIAVVLVVISSTDTVFSPFYIQNPEPIQDEPLKVPNTDRLPPTAKKQTPEAWKGHMGFFPAGNMNAGGRKFRSSSQNKERWLSVLTRLAQRMEEDKRKDTQKRNMLVPEIRSDADFIPNANREMDLPNNKMTGPSFNPTGW